MEIDRKLEKEYSLVVKKLSLGEMTWLYNQAKKENITKSDLVLRLIQEKKAGVQ